MTALQPGGTPLEDLPLRRHTVLMLRAEGVLTLGELRAMHDDELLQLRRFGAHSLADVRRLVPPPAASTGREVVIAGRAFRLGAVYARRPKVTVTLMPSGRQRVVAGVEWAAWAGEPVEDIGR
jgi:hypothetical protein